MLETFKARLKAKTKASGVNLSQKRIDAIADRLHTKNPEITEDAEHDKLIDDLDEVIDFKELARLEDQVRTAEAKLKPSKPAETKKSDDDPDEEDEEEKPKRDRTPSWAKGLIDSNKIMAEKLERFEGEKTRQTIREKIANHEKVKGKIPEKFYGKWQLPEKEEDIDSFIEDVATDYSEIVQENVNQTLLGGRQPISGSKGANDKPTEKELDSIIDKF